MHSLDDLLSLDLMFGFSDVIFGDRRIVICCCVVLRDVYSFPWKTKCLPSEPRVLR